MISIASGQFGMNLLVGRTNHIMKCPCDLNLIILGYVVPRDSVPLGHPVRPECARDEGDPPTELPEGLRLESDFLGNEMIQLSFPLNKV